VLLSPETYLIAGAFVVDTSGGHVEAPQWPGVLGPTGVREQGTGTQGLPRNLGDPAVSTDIFRLGNRNNNSPEPTVARPGRWEQTGRNGGIAKRRQRSAAKRTTGGLNVP